jgi:hypothetical protein
MRSTASGTKPSETHAPTHKRAKVTLIYADELGVRIADNGVRIAPLIADRGKMATSVFGEGERAARIAGKLTVTGSPASGTEIKLVVPGKVVYPKSTSDPEQPPNSGCVWGLIHTSGQNCPARRRWRR